MLTRSKIGLNVIVGKHKGFCRGAVSVLIILSPLRAIEYVASIAKEVISGNQ